MIPVDSSPLESKQSQYIFDEELPRGGGHHYDYDAAYIDEDTLKDTHKIVCKKCGVAGPKLPMGVMVDKEGIRYIISCWNCGVLIQVYKQVTPIFDWAFDWMAHQCWWEVAAIKELAKHPACYHTNLPLAVVDAFIEENGGHAVDDPEYALTKSDLSKPVICIEHPTTLFEAWMLGEIDIRGCYPVVLVDGWHRTYRAHKERKELPAIIIPRSFEMKFRVRDVIYLGCEGFPTVPDITVQPVATP